VGEPDLVPECLHIFPPSAFSPAWFVLSQNAGDQQKPLFLPIIAYTLSTTKLEIRAK
jgi:hypothetical protein